VPALVAELRRLTGAAAVRVVVAEDEVAREGLAPGAFAALSDAPASPVRIRENGLQFDVDLAGGQKTGFFLDQRENRRRVAAWARGRRLLSCYCYTGAFEVAAAAAGAVEILGLDRSAAALEQARAHHQLNKLSVPVTYERAEVPVALRQLRDAGRQFDLIVLDPPKFVLNRAQKEKGLRAYKDINLLALKLLAPAVGFPHGARLGGGRRAPAGANRGVARPAAGPSRAGGVPGQRISQGRALPGELMRPVSPCSA
jgi:23S rRNA (cytosine1962-C5)-methyltransferase